MTLNHFSDREGDRRVLMLIGGGIVAIIFAVIGAMALATLPDWAESVFSAIVGGSLVKLADVLSALVALSGNRQLERVTDQLSASTPPTPEGGVTMQAAPPGEGGQAPAEGLAP